jgi:hypothetical protein
MNTFALYGDRVRVPSWVVDLAGQMSDERDDPEYSLEVR